MRMYLQFGWGMMALAKKLLNEWKNSGIILSPRDLEPDQLVRTAKEAQEAGAEVLFDPQCFAHDADHDRLTGHDYWKVYRANSTGALLSGSGVDAVLKELAVLARAMGVTRHILPGMLAERVDDDWLSLHEQVIERAHVSALKDAPLIATIAISNEALRDEEQVEAVVERAASWNVPAVYVVGETPGPYLVEDAGWMGNLLILTSGLKLAGKEVLVGYCSHQSLALATSNVDVIASGTWQNVRAFQPTKFYAPEDKQSRRTLWYYCPQALTEYKLQTLDLAKRLGVLQQMLAPSSYGSTYDEVLFAGADPSSTQWAEPRPFLHYLSCLRTQVGNSRRNTFAETLAAHRSQLDNAEALLRRWKPSGLSGGDRDFSDCLDVNRGALSLLEAARGAQLKRQW